MYAWNANQPAAAFRMLAANIDQIDGRIQAKRADSAAIAEIA